MADWDGLPKGTHVQIFRDHVLDEKVLAKRLADFEVVTLMRERFPADSIRYVNSG